VAHLQQVVQRPELVAQVVSRALVAAQEEPEVQRPEPAALEAVPEEQAEPVAQQLEQEAVPEEQAEPVAQRPVLAAREEQAEPLPLASRHSPRRRSNQRHRSWLP
jgi:hypothetical protein